MLDRVPITSLDSSRQSENHTLGSVKALVQGPIAQEHLCPDEELLRIERLGEEVVGARSQPFQAGCAVVRCGDEDDGNEPPERVCLHTCAKREAIHARHFDVEQDEIRLIPVDLLERLLAVTGLAHLVAEVVEIALE